MSSDCKWKALSVAVAGEIQYLLGGKGNDALKALHHTPATRVIRNPAKPDGCAGNEINSSLENLGS